MMKSSTLTNFATGEICNLCGEPVIGEHVDWLHPDCYQQIMDDAREADEAEYQRVAALAKERGCSVEEMHIIEYAMETGITFEKARVALDRVAAEQGC